MAGKPKMLVVRGYHPDETFAIDVGIKFERINLYDNVFVKQYDGEPEPEWVIKRKSETPTLCKFIKRFSPLNYAIVLHDSSPIVERCLEFQRKHPGEHHPNTSLFYHSRGNISYEIKNKIENFCDSMEEILKGNDCYQRGLVLRFFAPYYRYIPKSYDLIEIEYFPHLISREEGATFLKTLIDILHAT